MNKKLLLTTFFAGAVIGHAALPSQGVVSFRSLPEEVRKAAEELLGAGAYEADTESIDGVEVYEIETSRDGRDLSVVLTTSGTVVEIEREIELQDLPEEIRKILETSPEREFEEILEVESHLYRFEFKEDGQKRQMQVYPTGRIVVSGEEREEDQEEDKDDQ